MHRSLRPPARMAASGCWVALCVCVLAAPPPPTSSRSSIFVAAFVPPTTHTVAPAAVLSRSIDPISRTTAIYDVPSARALGSSHRHRPSMSRRRRTSTVALNSVFAPASRSFASAVTASATRGVGSYYLTRILFLRGLALVYFVAFLVAYHQNGALIGDDGLTPARRVLDDAEERGRAKRDRREKWLEDRESYDEDAKGGGTGLLGVIQNTGVGKAVGDKLIRSGWYKQLREILWDRSDWMDRPVTTLLWLAKDRSKLNGWLNGLALTGLGLSAAVFALGSANVPLLLGLWLCQRSLMAVGGPWYGYGWEPQLAELGFHALFLVPLLSLDPLSTPVPRVVVWALRWYLFRIMIGAGLIKLKSGDPKWRFPALSAMDCFYETQPVPNPLTKYFHAAPRWWHKAEVGTNHFVELVAPWLLILPGLPRRWRIAGGVLQLAFQGVLITSGNLSFLNWLTAIPALFCLDDACLSRLFAPLRTASASVAAYTHLATDVATVSLTRRIVNVLFASLIVRLSVPVVRNLLAKKQRMNASFDPLRLVNSYGAFGTVSEDRDELIVQSTDDVVAGEWREYEFKVKPGDVHRRPRFISPYHYRLDWQMWIAAQAGGAERSPWLYSLLLKLLRQDEGVTGLLAKDPWASSLPKTSAAGDDGAGDGGSGPTDAGVVTGSLGEQEEKKPRYIRIEKYRYTFNYEKAVEDGGKRPYWKREYVGRYFPRQGIVTEDMLAGFVQ